MTVDEQDGLEPFVDVAPHPLAKSRTCHGQPQLGIRSCRMSRVAHADTLDSAEKGTSAARSNLASHRDTGTATRDGPAHGPAIKAMCPPWHDRDLSLCPRPSLSVGEQARVASFGMSESSRCSAEFDVGRACIRSGCFGAFDAAGKPIASSLRHPAPRKDRRLVVPRGRCAPRGGRDARGVRLVVAVPVDGHEAAALGRPARLVEQAGFAGLADALEGAH
jgi:hypothetical protein